MWRYRPAQAARPPAKITNFEDIVGSNFSDVLQGKHGRNILFGLDGNKDKLDGAAPEPTFVDAVGGLGADTDVGRQCRRRGGREPGEGNDTVQAGFSFALDLQFRD